MASILTTDVQTYVRELIAKEFGSVNQEKDALSENKESINGHHPKQQKQTAVSCQKAKDWSV
jgi:hypothetical protein